MFVPLQLLCIVEEINYGNIYTMEIVISKGSQNLWPLFTPKVSWRQNAENCLIWLGVEACPGSRVSPNFLAWNTNEILGKCTYFFCDIELMELFLYLHCYLLSLFWLISISRKNNQKIFWFFLKFWFDEFFDNYFRFINDPHAQIEHVVILSDKYMDMATVATFDVRRGCVEFNVINRFAEVGQMLAHIKRASNDLAESIFGDVCFHLWQEQFTKTMQWFTCSKK